MANGEEAAARNRNAYGAGGRPRGGGLFAPAQAAKGACPMTRFRGRTGGTGLRGGASQAFGRMRPSWAVEARRRPARS